MIHDVYKLIEEEFAEERIPGWCTLEKAIDLASVVVALRAKVIVEVGVFGGKSLIPMALACNAVRGGAVIGIDPWDHACSCEGYTGENANWWGGLNHETIYKGFRENIARLKLGHRVVIQRAKSDDVEPPLNVDLLHIDGQHSEQSLRDVLRFASRIRIGGICVMDDLDWKNDGIPHVALAADVLKKLGFVELYPSGTGAFFQRTSWGVVKLSRSAAKRRAKR